MKKYLLLLASAALLLVGCAKESFVEQQEGELVTATFTASLDNSVATKAAVDGDGAAASVNRCIMEIYYGDDFYARKYAKVTDKKATFTAQVVSNRKYTVAFWADCVDDASTDATLAEDKYYTTTPSLKEISFKKEDEGNIVYFGNNDARDAFFFVDEYTVAQAGSSFGAGEEDKILLKRPFAQMNVITTDWDKAKKVTGLAPEKVKVTIKNALVKFNAVTGVASGSQTLTYEAAVYTPAAHGAEKTLSMDYLFAPKTDKAYIDIDWKALHGTDTDVKHAFAAVPYQRNYRTNIKGNLLTTTGNWTVTVDSDWTHNGTTVEGGEDPYLVNYYQAGSIAAANEALKTNNAVSIENPSDLAADIIIPAEQDGKNVLIKVSGASAGNIKVIKAEEGPASLAIESDSNTLDIDLPDSHVDVNKGANYTKITAKTGDNTLVIGKDVVAAALNVQKGSVEIHGKVADFTRATGIKAKFYVSDGTTLKDYVTWAEAGEIVELESDIDLDGTTWEPLVLNADFNGNGHIIKNIQNLNCAPDYAGLFNVSYSNIKNVTIQNAEFAYDNSSKAARGGALVGDMRRGSIENCHVDVVKFTGYQKVGGLVGFISANADNGTDISIKNCSVKNATFAACGADDKYLYQTGGLIGYIQLGNRNISISNCSVEDIVYDITKYYGVYNDASDNNGYLSHTFVGIIFSDTNNEANTLSFTANTISGTKNTPLNASMYGSAYFGWARNPEYKSGTPVTLGKITIDGGEWTPNYLVKNVTKGLGYETLADAVSAADEGNEINILKAGTYTVPGISKNITITGAAEGDVVFDCNGSGSIAAIPNGATFKNVTMNFGQSSYHGFQHAGHIIMEECVLNGLFFSYGDMTFNSCVFNQDTEEYSMWDYGNDLTYNECEFHGKGKFINVYCESNATTYKLIANKCKFYSDKVNKSAFNIKETCGSTLLRYDVEINGCETNENFPTDKIGGSKIWMVDDQSSTGESFITVKVDGEKVYPLTTFHVSTAEALRKAVKCVNAGKEATEYTIILADGTYEVSDIAIAENANGKKVIIKSANPKGATLKMNSGSKTREIFLIDGCSNVYSTSSVTFEGLKFEILAGTDSDNCAAPVYAFKQDDPLAATIGYTAAHAQGLRYAHDITISNCELKGAGVGTNSMMFYAKNNTSAKDITVTGCTIQAVDYLYSGYASNFTASNCVCNDEIKAFVNHQVTETNTLTISGCTIKAKHDYIIRTSSGPVSIVNNTFYASWTGDESDNAGAIVLRNNASTAQIIGNTFNKADNDMADVYCNAACTVNNMAKEAGSKINF